MTSPDRPGDGRRALLDRLLATPTRLAALVDEGRGRVPGTGEWPTATVVLHLLAVEEDVWGPRLRQMHALDDPAWAWTEPDLADRDGGRTVDEILSAFAARRAETVLWLDTLDDEGWARIGTHATFGILDVAGLMREALLHDEEHLAELERRAGGVIG